MPCNRLHQFVYAGTRKYNIYEWYQTILHEITETEQFEEEISMKKKLIALMMMLAMVFCLAACGGNSEPAEEETPEPETQEETSEETAAAPAAPEDIVVDAEAGTVTITAQVNGTFFDQSTMHCVVFKDGGAGDKAMMVEAGGEPWCTDGSHLEDGEFTDGQKVDVSFTWDGQTEPVALADALKTDDGRPDVDMRFSGNQQGNKEAGSGCIACLNSCWAGITSNAAYAFGAIDSGNPHVYLDDSVMPADGTDVTVTFTLQK